MNYNLIDDGLKKINMKIDSIETQDMTNLEETIKQKEIIICTPIFESINQKINNIPPENHLEIPLSIIDLQKEHIDLRSKFVDTEKSEKTEEEN